MKFLCDRCKTRYSIGDDRVRGKILKIRCKNCANVITVREGMDAAEGEAAAPAARTHSATGAQVAVTAAPTGALGAAFANQLSKPPPALEEEWYVSIDGVQSGPFSLTDAQRWVAGKPFEAELHCWSEGFDDWLPVDKVSHFRGLRKKPEPRRAPTAPPPIPRREDEPKPLFAATMAQLERSVGAPAAPAMPLAQPAPAVARTNGHGLPGATGRGTGASPALPRFGQASPSGATAQPSPAAAALADAFSRPAVDEGESRTSVDVPPFSDDIATTAAKPSTVAKPAVKPIHDDSDDDDGLEIGEVSRVVKLADIATMGRRSSQTMNPATSPATRSTGSMPRLNANQTGTVPRLGMTGPMPRVGGMTGSISRLTPSELGMNVDPALAAAGGPQPDESFASKHRRGLLLLISAAAVMVLGVIALVVFVTSGGGNDEVVGLGGTRHIDTSRPEDIVRRSLPPTPGTGSGSAITKVEQKPKTNTNTGPRITNQNPNTQQQPEEPKGDALRASDIEDMAAKQAEGTKRCYMRAQKGAIGFEIADLKKIEVTLTVGKDGVVKDVSLSSHGGDSFGECLIARIKAWKFRESSGGTFRISLAFSAS